MATQVDSLNNGSFKAFRPWRRREPSPGRAPQTASSMAGAASITSTSLSPSPTSTRSDRRSRTRLPVSAPALSVSPASSPSYLYSYSADPRIAPRPGLGIAYTYTYTGTRSPPETLENGNGQHHASQPQDSQPDHPTEEATPPASHTKPASSSSSPDKTAPPPSRPARHTVPSARCDADGRPSLKRRRALSDVDGPNTAVLCCKKRRLRRFLITSRLSQPFSQPASHILNRESVASGDKRFLKLAAIMNARRIRMPQAAAAGVPPPPEAVWRTAMANRFRKRIFTADAALGRSIAAGAPVQLMNSARLTMVPVSTAASMAAVRASGVHTMAYPVPVARMMVKSPLAGIPPAASHSACRNNAGQPPAPAALLPPTQAAFVLPASPLSTGSCRSDSSGVPSIPRGRSHSRSPQLRPVRDRTPVRASKDIKDTEKLVEQDYPRPLPVDDDDDGGCAFPTSEHGSRYEVDDYDDEDDRPDDEVYADFSVLFSSSGDDNDWGSGSEEGLDDYMDELDGIAHLPR